MNLEELLDRAKTELEDMASLENPGYRLEQAEYREDEKIWDVVISFLVDHTNLKQTLLSTITTDF